MKLFFGFVKKEFYHILRDRRSLFILFGMPIIQILLFGFAITNEINNVNIAIFDHSKDITTQEIINKISASSYFSINQLIENETDNSICWKYFKFDEVNDQMNDENDTSRKIYLFSNEWNQTNKLQSNLNIIKKYLVFYLDFFGKNSSSQPLILDILKALLYNFINSTLSSPSLIFIIIPNGLPPHLFLYCATVSVFFLCPHGVDITSLVW